MGIRFRCHHCEFELHVKDFQAGKRGRCPECKGKFRIPLKDADHSLEVDSLPAANAQDESTPVPQNAIPQTLPAQSKQPQTKQPQTKQPQTKQPQTKQPQTKQPQTKQPQAKQPQAAPTAGQASPQQSADSHVATEQVTANDIPAMASSGEGPPSESNPTAEPLALTEAPGATWYVRPTSGGQYGPASSTTVSQWLTENRVGRDALVWRDDWPDWLPAASVFEDFFVKPTVGAGSTDSPPEPNSLAAQTSPASPLNPPGSLSERNRAVRKSKRRRNYIVMISVLTVTMIGLVITLIVVLLMQDSQ